MILEGMLIGGMIAGAGLLLLGRKGIRRAAGYLRPADAALSAYGISTGAASGTAMGVLGGFAGAVLLSLGLRGFAAFTGVERLSVNGDDSVRVVAAAALSQASWWVRSTVASLWKGGETIAPPELDWAWKEISPPKTAGQLAAEFWADFEEWRYA